ncbi:MAG TPA: hypothetical protein VGN63_05330 [Flavisolibacter sp.]|jgi:uncharacterized coiled-coil protein SlyX|nr:hypothetical protein [Flavisolibacter sp.]
MNFNPFANLNGNSKDTTSEAEKLAETDSESAFHKGVVPETSSYEGNYTYKKYGFIQSKNHGASPISLEMELNKIFEMFKDRLRKDEQEQERMKVPLRAKLESLKIDKETFAKKIEDVKGDLIPSLNKKIQTLKDEISAIRRDPSAYQKEKPNRVSFVFGAVIGGLLTVYLWIFYTSASYSAFFRKFEADDINVANSIFDAAALTKAYHDGIPSLVLVISMPFIFLGLGFLIHKVSQNKSNWKYLHLTLLILVTLGFDYIIAYEIVQKVYELKAAASLQELPPYRFENAISDMNFWLIMFAGFVTYLIWGFLFDKMMEEYEKFDVLKVQIKIREGEIKELQKELKVQEAQIDELKHKIAETEKQIKTTEEDLSATFFKAKEFEHIIYQFTSGWMQFVEGGLIANEEKKNNLRNEISEVTKRFIHVNNNVPHVQ